MALGTPSVNATRHPGGHAVSLSVSAPGAAGFTVYRTVDGNDYGREGRFNVRGFVNVAATSASGYDVDYPQNASIAYRVVAWDNNGNTATSALSASISPMSYGGDVLIGNGATALRASIIVYQLASVAYTAKVEQVKVLGRRDPVAISDRRQYPTFDLTFHTFTFAEYQAVEDILYRFPVVTFSPQYPRWADSSTALHLSVADVEPLSPNYRRSTTGGVLEERAWTIRAAQVAAPATPACTTLPVGW